MVDTAVRQVLYSMGVREEDAGRAAAGLGEWWNGRHAGLRNQCRKA